MTLGWFEGEKSLLGMGEELCDQESGLDKGDWPRVSKSSFVPRHQSSDPLASLTTQVVCFHSPRSSAVSNLNYTYCSKFLRPFMGSRWLLVQTNEYFPTQSLQLR